MALKQSVQVANKHPVISACGYEAITVVGDYTVAAGLVLNDVIEMAILPGGYVPLGIKLACDDIDTGAGLVLDCGILSGTAGLADNARTCGNEAFAASTIGQTGGVVNELKANILMAAPTDSDRGIGLKIGTAAAGLVVGAKIRLTLTARPKINGV
jgi:hypothetical protein